MSASIRRPTAAERVAVRALRSLPPDLPGKGRIARVLLRDFYRYDSAVVVETDWGPLKAPSGCEPIVQHLLSDGAYEHGVLEALRRVVPDSGVLIDVGANIGAITIPLAKHVGPNGLVIGIEADRSVFSFLEENVRLTQSSNVQIVNQVASDLPDRTADFYRAPSRKFGMGSLTPQFGDTPEALGTCSLDALLRATTRRRVDAIKIDVEGHENAVLAGGKQMLTGPHPPVVVFEFADWAERNATGTTGLAQRRLLGWGYRIWTVSAWLAGQPPLERPARHGDEMLLAIRGRRG